MEQKRYIISDAAGFVKVETHVLRYWEEELELKIPRNELGHRYYTLENIEEFKRIKELKEQGYQLKAIKALIHSKDEQMQTQDAKKEGDMHISQESLSETVYKGPIEEENTTKTNPLFEITQPTLPTNASEKKNVNQRESFQNNSIERFQLLMNVIVKKAIEENNIALGKEVTRQVAERILKEMNYLARTQEEQEEERYRKLDEAIRANQKGRKKRREKEKKQAGGKHLLRPKFTT